MTTQATIQKEVEKLKERVKPKRENRIVVRLWMPHGEDHDDPNNLFILKATNKEDRKVKKREYSLRL
ncbi:MAG: hypothetical protein OEZ35_08325 [Candidatus Bathyarchaeota archaeon]|nr:hypothetical protein [Candidatus Bathyarchaeota archaeon]